MRIEDVRTFTLRGLMPCEGEFWEERLVRPIDVYQRFREEGPGSLKRVSESTVEVAGTYLEIATDEGVSGIAGPIDSLQVSIINGSLKPLLLGEDPYQVEKFWDQMYRLMVHGRKGETMMAISAVDCALWDLKGKALKQPVYKLLGGPTRDRVRAYASTLGYSLKPEAVAKRCQSFVEEGYTAMKWFFRHSPADGVKGVERNLELVKTVRDTVGYNVDLMVDCWMSWSVPYTIKMAGKLERYELAWIEEPLLPDDVDGYAEVAAAVETPIAGGEHEYTRWGFNELIKHKALDILQPDIMWAGGISEVLKICALASVTDVSVVPHTGFMASTVNLLLSQTETLCPIAEYLVKWNMINQAFYKEQLKPEKGFFKPTSKPGLGFEFDEGKVVEKT